MKILFTYIFLFLFALFGKAQELPLYSQYILNPYLINPAIAGIDGCGNIQAVSGIKWVGMSDAPRTFALSYHQGFNKIGLGSYVFSDRNGFNSNLGFQITFAYHLNIDASKFHPKLLSFGLSFCGNQHSLNESAFTNNGYDPIVSGTIQNSFMANANAGVYYISKNFFTGFSCADLFNSSNKIFTSQLEPVKFRNYFFQIGYNFWLNLKYQIEPSITTKASEHGDKQIDTNVKFMFRARSNKKFWAAISLRKNIIAYSPGSLTYMPIFGYSNTHYSITYAFNYSTGSINNRTFGSHEIMLGYHFCSTKRRMVACPAFRSFRNQKQ